MKCFAVWIVVDVISYSIAKMVDVPAGGCAVLVIFNFIMWLNYKNQVDLEEKNVQRL